MFLSVEMSGLKRVVGLRTPWADKVALHEMACGDVETLLALIERVRSRTVKGNGEAAVTVCHDAGHGDFGPIGSSLCSGYTSS
jgi:hypothetical protein